MVDDRMIRQEILIPQRMKRATVVLVGVGMLGSWLAHALARTVDHLIIFDHDIVEAPNLGTQAYDRFGLGEPKVAALARQMNGLPVSTEASYFDGKSSPAQLAIVTTGDLIVVSAVDSFEGRRIVADWAKTYANFFVDLRCHGTVGVVVAHPTEEIPDYLSHLESDETAPEPTCGAEGCTFTGMWVAQRATATIAMWASGLPYQHKTVFDAAMQLELTPQPVGA